jgi:outer membrane protein TolC
MNLSLYFLFSLGTTISLILLTSTKVKAIDTQQNLNQNPNPLQFPTKPEEVKIQQNQPISLDEAVQLAQRNNRDLQATILQLERSKFAVKEAQAALLPTVSLDGSMTRSRSANGQLSAEISNTTNPSTTSFNGQVQITYNLYTSGRRQATIRQAEEQVRVDEFNVENKSEEIRLNTITQYYDLQAADEQVRINRSAVENARSSLRDAQAQEKAGVGTRFDSLRAQVNLSNAQQNLTSAISQQQIAQRKFVSLLSIPQSVNVSAKDPVKLVGLWNKTLEESIIQAYQNRPELQQQLAQRNINEQKRRQVLSALGPQISLTGSYSLLDQYNDGISVTDGYSLGLKASWSLFDGGAAKAQAQQAKKNIAIAEVNFAQQRDQIRFDVEQYYAQLQSNLDNIQTSTVALDQAKEALRLARLRFQAGVGTQTDVISAENDLTQAEGNRVTAILNYNRALANLQRAITISAQQRMGISTSTLS